jgi:hypothetical protein
MNEKLTGESLRTAQADLGTLGSMRGVPLLEKVLELSKLCDPAVDAFCDDLSSSSSVDEFARLEAQLSSLIANGSIPNWLKPDLQLAFCRWLLHQQLFDESQTRLQLIAQEPVSDPATWMFCMAVCQHHLLQKAPCMETLEKLLERETELPTRYAITARLMQSDIEPLKEDSLDEISRMMNDVERRLSLGRAGKQVRDQEQAIVDKLEKMIDKLEKQQQQQQQQQKQKQKDKQNQPQQSNGKPMDQSQVAGEKGPGEVDEKDIGNDGGWGNLPPAERQEALQSMTKDLPSHYREVIEAYFKRLASSGTKP